MKIKLLLSALVISAFTSINGTVLAQTAENTNIIDSNKITKDVKQTEKINNIKKLMEITGSKKMSQQVMNQMIAGMRKQLPQVPQQFWDGVIAEYDPNIIMNELIPIYAKYYTNDELEQIVAFYETPLGKKITQVMPQVMQESMQVGQKYGVQIAQTVLKKLQAEGYLPKK
ncbi:DUF2059 domain-containing protein [Calothrix rhizosoleniae]|uniref:DUF2059 domain-containing protein n=1 Tax=Calothrix rhizosoleniae TaxID=888997 RepID=UPI000B4A2AC1|nr:DUF2059 domain-containing protein [Calothrix rhizosoleniae]